MREESTTHPCVALDTQGYTCDGLRHVYEQPYHTKLCPHMAYTHVRAHITCTRCMHAHTVSAYSSSAALCSTGVGVCWGVFAACGTHDIPVSPPSPPLPHNTRRYACRLHGGGIARAKAIGDHTRPQARTAQRQRRTKADAIQMDTSNQTSNARGHSPYT
jgi:hypothetical protein